MPKKTKLPKAISASELASQYYDNADIKILLKISASTVYRWRNKEILKFSKIGPKFFYPKAVIERLMAIRNE
ncbi:helix-turn-helix domain-containing protein [Flavobacterium tegetincola]|uniref:helix-turn-helix domain-containing protein n=1 Tax=Flavobacterium tegetincola TaxID=150172 RepID=UPI000400CFB8|nr:helix-turn-helix domain-containing protein [Flavobacterium tegetincola]